MTAKEKAKKEISLAEARGMAADLYSAMTGRSEWEPVFSRFTSYSAGNRKQILEAIGSVKKSAGPSDGSRVNALAQASLDGLHGNKPAFEAALLLSVFEMTALMDGSEGTATRELLVALMKPDAERPRGFPTLLQFEPSALSESPVLARALSDFLVTSSEVKLADTTPVWGRLLGHIYAARRGDAVTKEAAARALRHLSAAKAKELPVEAALTVQWLRQASGNTDEHRQAPRAQQVEQGPELSDHARSLLDGLSKQIVAHDASLKQREEGFRKLIREMEDKLTQLQGALQQAHQETQQTKRLHESLVDEHAKVKEGSASLEQALADTRSELSTWKESHTALHEGSQVGLDDARAELKRDLKRAFVPLLKSLTTYVNDLKGSARKEDVQHALVTLDELIRAFHTRGIATPAELPRLNS